MRPRRPMCPLPTDGPRTQVYRHRTMSPRSVLVALLISLLVAGCSEGRVSGASASDDAEVGDPPPEAEDYDAGPYPDDIGPEDFPIPPEDGGLKKPDPPPWDEDAGEPPDPPEPPPEDAGDAPRPGDDAGLPPVPDHDAGVALPTLLPRYSTVFSTRPQDSAPDTAVEDLLLALIRRAVPGSRIRVAVYHFTRGRVSEALVAAFRRGVDVRVLLDGGVRAVLDDPDAAEITEAPTLILGLGRSRVTLCRAPGGACLGTNIMHHKTFLFSDVGGGSRNVVVQASHNLTTTQTHLHNNAVVVRGDSALFAAYERTFEQQRRDVVQENYYRASAGNFRTRAYFFPRAAGDTAVAAIDSVSCEGGGRIRVAMAFFTNARLEVARALARRRREGCGVEVVVGDSGIRVGRQVLAALRDAGVRVTRYPTRSGGWGLHSKYLIIDARYGGSSARRRLVFTGSHNWTRGALRDNDETMLRVEDDGVFNAFMADWARLRLAAVRR